MPFDSPIAFSIMDKFSSAEKVTTFVFKGTLESFPGQFVNIWIPELDEKPFSIARDFDGEFWITVCAVGRFSHALLEKKIGEKVGIRGPYGHGFSTPEWKNIVLVGGGYGMAPLFYAGVQHRVNHCRVIAITGARNEKNVLFEEECNNAGFRTFITTDDGTRGEKAFTTEVLEKILKTEKIHLVQTCGPEKMMRRVAEICRDYGVVSEVSIERYMKCGFGVCGQCVVDGTGERMCKTGPVVQGEYALDYYQDFGAYHRGSEGQKIEW
jgi:dihydroorotate dehydrogenase electron transfer subunit